MKLRRHPLLVMLLALAMALTACGGDGNAGDVTGPDSGSDGEQAQGEVEDRGTIKLYDPQHGSTDVLNAVGGFIAKHAWGYEPELETVHNPIMWKSLPRGDIHLNFELWRINAPDVYEEVTSSGQVVDLGPSFDRAAQGFYVPAYVIEGDEERGIEPMAPDLRSVQQLAGYTELFADPDDPSKGRLVSCLPQWQCSEVNRAKMGAYGLLDDYNLQEPGAPAALEAAIKGAYEQGNPILAYYWEPTALAGQLDLTRLEEPEWTEECSQAITEVRESGNYEGAPAEAGCAYNNVAIHKGINAEFAEEAPADFVAFLEAMLIPTDVLNEVLSWMSENEAEPEATATHFFEAYPDIWQGWLDDQARQRVQQALGEAG